MDQRGADALAALTECRRLACACGQPGCPSSAGNDEPERDRSGAQVVVSVVASDETVYGMGTQPGYLEGYGVLDAEQVRQFAAAASAVGPYSCRATAPFSAMTRAAAAPAGRRAQICAPRAGRVQFVKDVLLHEAYPKAHR